MDNEKIIGRRIRAAREESGLSQEQLGSLIGYSAMGVSHIENGSRKVKLEDLQKIAEKLRVEISYLLEPITKQTPTVIFRRGDEDTSEEQKKAEQKALTELDSLIRNMDNSND